MKHRTSKSASDDFWELAKIAFPQLYKAKTDDMVYKDIPKFISQRRKLYREQVPPIKLEIAFQNKDTEEIIVVEGSTTPVSRFHPRKFRKLFEVSTVEVWES